MDLGSWKARTDIIVVADPDRRRLLWVPRDLWNERLGDRVNTAFARGGHRALLLALREHGIEVGHSVCLRREATTRALAGVSVTVPVAEPMRFRYPLAPERPIEEGSKLISFEPPAELLGGERLHQWVGARYKVRGGSSDLGRIERQQRLVTALLSERYDFSRALVDDRFVSISGPEALAELSSVDEGWRCDVVRDLRTDWIDGKCVLVRADRTPWKRLPALARHRAYAVRLAWRRRRLTTGRATR